MKPATLLTLIATLLTGCASPQPAPRAPEYWNYGPYQIIPPSAYLIRRMNEQVLLDMYREQNQ